MLTNTSINFAIAAQLSTAFGTDNSAITAALTLASGTLANQADIKFIGRRSVVAGTPDALDLNGGGLTQRDGSPFNAVEVVAVQLVNRSTTSTLTYGGGSNAVANIAGTIKPLGMVCIVAPGDPAYPVTAGTADILQVVSSVGTAVYDVLVIGRSA